MRKELQHPAGYVYLKCMRLWYHETHLANRALERQSTRTFAFVFFSLLRAVGCLLCLATACSACSTCRLRCAGVTSCWRGGLLFLLLLRLLPSGGTAI